jgi:hypothetical protein
MSKIRIEITGRGVPFGSVSSVHYSFFRHYVLLLSVLQNVEMEPVRTKVRIYNL